MFTWPLLKPCFEYDRGQAGRDPVAACLICLWCLALAYAQLAGGCRLADYTRYLPMVYALIGANPD
jgi:SulP family sulfate permease